MIFIAPTDTVYGILTSALSKQDIDRIYKIKGRDKDKKLIILISKISDLNLFKVILTKEQKIFLQKHWPNKLSVILQNKNQESICFRIPKTKIILNLIKKYGPLVAPSANLQGQKTVETIREAKKVFGNSVDKYISYGKKLSGKSSTIIKLEKDGSFEILRQGDYREHYLKIK